MEMRADHDPDRQELRVTGTISDREFTEAVHSPELVRATVMKVRERVLEIICEKFLEEHLQDVLTEINPKAIANLAIARIASQIAETLKEKT